jgi:hypothetical protein
MSSVYDVPPKKRMKKVNGDSATRVKGKSGRKGQTKDIEGSESDDGEVRKKSKAVTKVGEICVMPVYKLNNSIDDRR